MGKNFGDLGSTPIYNEAFSNMDKAATTKRNYTKKAPADKQEAAERASAMKTQGREGCKLNRISMAFTPENYEYIRLIAGMTGTTMTGFVNHLVEISREENTELIETARKLKASL